MIERIRLALQGKKKTLILVAVGFLIVIVGALFMVQTSFRSSLGQAIPQTSNTTTNPSSLPRTNVKGKFPVIKVGNWTHRDPPLLDEKLYSSYTFKTIFSISDINTFASKFGFSNKAEMAGNTAFFARPEAFMYFNTTSGSYIFFDKKGVSIGDSTAPIGQNIQAYIEKLGVNDGTLRTVNTYKKKSQSGIVYFELHRDWASVGGPILNQLGILNLPETSVLSSLNQNTFKSTAKDDDIYGTNDGSDGYKRADEFNTMTIGMEEATQKVVTMRSNIRPFLSQTAPQPLISYSHATQLLAGGQATSIYTAPAGQGVVDWKKVYPSDTVQIQNAEVTQSVISYLEELPVQTQISLTPYYLFKGFAQSPSGYRIQFIAAIDAIDHSVTPRSLINRLVGQAWAQQPNSSGLKLGTFSFITPSATHAPTNGITPTSIPDSSSECIPLESELENVSDWSGLGVGYYEGRLPLTPLSQPAGYYIVSGGSAGLTEGAVIAWIDSVLERGTSQQFRDIQDIMRDILTVPDCPIRLTGASPTIFVYGDIQDTYVISPKTNVTYADPALNTTKWNVDVGTRDLTINGVARPYLYYEYEKIDFDRPTEGWVVDKQDIYQFAQNIGMKFGFNRSELERFQFELNHAAIDIEDSTVFVGVISPSEIEEKLPLEITPNDIHVERLHFYIGEVLGEEVREPLVVPIQRVPKMVLEIGAARYSF